VHCAAGFLSPAMTDVNEWEASLCLIASLEVVSDDEMLNGEIEQAMTYIDVRDLVYSYHEQSFSA
jgi:hypothetical protein